MINYLGSKKQISDDILSVILKHREPNQTFVDLFTGGGSILSNPLLNGKILANDLNFYAYKLLHSLSKGWKPSNKLINLLCDPQTSVHTYNEYKNHWLTMKNSQIPDENMDIYPDEEIAYVGFSAYHSRFFQGYPWGTGRTPNPENFKITYRNCLIGAQAIQGKDITFSNNSYLNLIIPDNSIIYCDPPYAGENIKGYDLRTHDGRILTSKKSDKFDHAEFWLYCNRMHEAGHIVFVSEYSTPNDSNFVPVWIKKKRVGNMQINKFAFEKLYVHVDHFKKYCTPSVKQKQNRHKWTKEQEDILYLNNTLPSAKIKEIYFSHINTITTQAIADKVSRVTDKREQPNYGKPWSAEDEDYLRVHINKNNVELKFILGRGSKELDKAKWDIRHTGAIAKKRA